MDYFKDHFNKRKLPSPDEIANPQNYPHLRSSDECELLDINENQPDREDMEKTTKSMKNGKCKDPSGVYSEQIKYNTSSKLMQILVTLMTLIWSTITVPSSWLHSLITCLYKNKGDRMDADNYRGLSITFACSKILIRIIINRFKALYEAMLLPTQFGFRENKSTNDAIFALRNVIDNTSDELFCCFIDLKAAYDWTDRGDRMDVKM